MVYENYMALALVHPSPKTRTYTVQNRLFVPSNSTAQRYRECKIHLCTLRTHFPSLHHAYKLLMQEKFTQENNNKCNQRINHISLHTHTYYIQFLLWAIQISTLERNPNSSHDQWYGMGSVQEVPRTLTKPTQTHQANLCSKHRAKSLN